MNIDLHIERLVLEGIDLAAPDTAALKRAVEERLRHLAANEGIHVTASHDILRAGTIVLENRPDPSKLGRTIADAVHGGLQR